jgi:hypothetical protein
MSRRADRIAAALGGVVEPAKRRSGQGGSNKASFRYSQV